MQTPESVSGTSQSGSQPVQVSPVAAMQQRSSSTQAQPSAAMQTQPSEIPLAQTQQTLGQYGQSTPGQGLSGQFEQSSQQPGASEWSPTAGQQTMLLGSQYEQSVPQEVRAAIEDVNHLNNVLDWAKTRLTQRGNGSAARACEDVHDCAEMTKEFMLRDSPFASGAARELQRTIQGASRELQQHSNEPEIQEVLSRIQQTNGSIEQSIPRLQSGSLS
ncbi:hypothetical protein [Halobellus salinisoli]|uniref:hypothetical protein n=1 Tax=Halobellus salinisoli TaxID=3108500 RepID=UPI003008A2BE